MEEVNAGRLQFPAHKRPNESLVGIWRDVRLEAISHLFNFGQADPILLADRHRQSELLRCLIDERPHLEMPQPRGEIIADTLQSVWQAYLYLSKVGSEVADRETDYLTLKLAKKNIFDFLFERAKEIRIAWTDFETALNQTSGKLPEMPKTLLEEAYADITAKTKSIALSTKFGPSYEEGIKHMEKYAKEKLGDSAQFRELIDRILNATDPDEFA